jgi:DNA-binding beta-propeller fold protein YncE
VNNFGSNTVSAFRFDSAGTLTPVAVSPTGQTPIGLAADPSGQFIYVGNHMGNSITAYSVAPRSGALTPVGGPPSSAGACGVSCHTNPLRLTIDPTGRFAYASNVGNNTVSVYALSKGMLAPLAPPLSTGRHPFGLTLDATGKFLYVVNKVDNTISAFSVNAPQTMFSEVPGSPFRSGGSGPVGIVIVPTQ